MYIYVYTYIYIYIYVYIYVYIYDIQQADYWLMCGSKSGLFFTDVIARIPNDRDRARDANARDIATTHHVC